MIMKKNYTIKKLLILFCACIFTYQIHAQWAIYDGSVIPNDENAASIQDFKDTTFNTGDLGVAAFIAEIVDDPDITENKLFHYETREGGDSETTYRINDILMGNEVGTFVFRVKGTPDGATPVSGDDNPRIFELDVRGTVRSKLTIRYDDTIALYIPSDVKDEYANLAEWNLYRFTIDDDLFTAYLNENPTPILSGVSDRSSGDWFFKWADGSDDNSFAFYLDWLIWDLSGNYAPGEGTAIPSELSTEYYSSTGTKAVTSFTVYPNPANEYLYLRSQTGVTGSYVIYSMLGNVVRSGNITKRTTRIDMRGLNEGLYFIQTKFKDQIQTNPIILR